MKYIFLKNKNRNLSLIFLLVLIILLGPSLKERCADTMCALQKLEHRIEYSKKGSRSEAQHGYLFFNGNAIPDVFTYIRGFDGDYRFYTRKYTWGRDGYFPADEAWKKPFKISKKKISSSNLRAGWYKGKVMLKNTPQDWFYAEWDGGNAFVSPEAVESIVKSLNLKTIPRDMEMSVFPGKEKD